MACRRSGVRSSAMRTRSILLLCAAVIAVGGVFVWGKYHRTDPVSAEAAMQQPEAAQTPAQGQNGQGQNGQGLGKPAAAVKVAEVTQASMPIIRRTIGWVEPIAAVAVKSRINSLITEQH